MPAHQVCLTYPADAFEERPGGIFRLRGGAAEGKAQKWQWRQWMHEDAVLEK